MKNALKLQTAQKRGNVEVSLLGLAGLREKRLGFDDRLGINRLDENRLNVTRLNV